jgi:predicted RND superfamily exporter protein
LVFTRAFRDGCIKAALYAVIFIFIFLLLTFRDLKATLLALVPLLIGTAWTLGLMHLFKVDLNLANSLFMPLVVGAAVEYAIIILHRWRQKEKNKEGVVLPFSTAMGVILAGLTTTVGFGSLMISSHQGIYSLGLLATIGSLSILAAAVLFLPALLQFSSTFAALGRGKT